MVSTITEIASKSGELIVGDGKSGDNLAGTVVDKLKGYGYDSFYICRHARYICHAHGFSRQPDRLDTVTASECGRG